MNSKFNTVSSPLQVCIVVSTCGSEWARCLKAQACCIAQNLDHTPIRSALLLTCQLRREIQGNEPTHREHRLCRQLMSMHMLMHIQLFATPWTIALQAPPSIGFSRQEHWSGLPLPLPVGLPAPGIKPASASAGRFFATVPPGWCHLAEHLKAYLLVIVETGSGYRTSKKRTWNLTSGCKTPKSMLPCFSYTAQQSHLLTTD